MGDDLDADGLDRLVAAQIAAGQEREAVTLGCIAASHRAAVPSVIRRCARCGQNVWVSRRVLAILKPTAEIVCTDCVVP